MVEIGLALRDIPNNGIVAVLYYVIRMFLETTSEVSVLSTPYGVLQEIWPSSRNLKSPRDQSARGCTGVLPLVWDTLSHD